MDSFFSVMWATVRALLLLVIGFAAIVYLGNQAGVLEGHAGAYELCLTANGVPAEATIRDGVDKWADVVKATMYMPEERKLGTVENFYRSNPRMWEYFRWLEFYPTAWNAWMQPQPVLDDAENIQGFIDARRAEVSSLC